MKKKIKEILGQFAWNERHGSGYGYSEEYTITAILEVFKAAIPETPKAHTYASENADDYIMYECGFSDCRAQMIKNLDKP